MTRIDFHTNVAHKLDYACRVVRKAVTAQQTVVVYCSDTARLHAFDQALWAFSPLDFLPHCYAHDPLAIHAPIVLTSTDDTPKTHQVLVNLDDAWPPFFSTFERLIEIVSAEETDRNHGRTRYRFYRERGYALNNHDQQSS